MASNRIDVILELIDATLAEYAQPAFATGTATARATATATAHSAESTPRAVDADAA